MNTFGKLCPLQPNYLGNFLCVNDVARSNLSTSTADPILLVWNPSVRSTYQTFMCNATAGVFIQSSPLCPLMKCNSSTGSDTPAADRLMRAGISITQTSAHDTVQGQVEVLIYSSQIVLTYAGGVSGCDLTLKLCAGIERNG